MPSNRLSEIDITRGFVMVLMALDHTRDFLGDHSIDALDVVYTSVPLFFERWLTHLCAPTFVFLAGISVALAGSKQPGLPLSQLALRGLWLVVLEQTLLRCFGWYFNFDYRFMNAGILWGTGWAMVLLAGVLALRLPAFLIGILGLVLMITHSFLAVAVDSNWCGTLLLRSDELFPAPGWHFYVSYPVLPWFGVMAFGYGAGALIQKAGFNPPTRRALFWSGIGMTLLFILLRIPNLLDPDPWSIQSRTGFTILSFINTEKYPPSFLYLLMTLGPMVCFMALASYLPEAYSAAFDRAGTSTAVLLLGSHCPDSPVSGTSRLPPIWTCRVAISGARDFLVGNLAWPPTRVWPGAWLGCGYLVAGDRAVVAGLPVVRPV